MSLCFCSLEKILFSILRVLQFTGLLEALLLGMLIGDVGLDLFWCLLLSLGHGDGVRLLGDVFLVTRLAGDGLLLAGDCCCLLSVLFSAALISRALLFFSRYS